MVFIIVNIFLVWITIVCMIINRIILMEYDIPYDASQNVGITEQLHLVFYIV